MDIAKFNQELSYKVAKANGLEKHKRFDSPPGFACAKTFIPLSVGGEIINILKLLSLESSTSIILVRISISLTQRSKKPDTAR